MRNKRNWLAVVGILTASFAGGGLSHWLLSGGRSAHTQQAAGVKTVRAKSFIVEDENGTVRAMLSVDGRGPRLDLRDLGGSVRAWLAVSQYGPSLTLADGNGTDRVLLWAQGDRQMLVLRDENGKLAWSTP